MIFPQRGGRHLSRSRLSGGWWFDSLVRADETATERRLFSPSGAIAPPPDSSSRQPVTPPRIGTGSDCHPLHLSPPHQGCVSLRHAWRGEKFGAPCTSLATGPYAVERGGCGGRSRCVSKGSSLRHLAKWTPLPSLALSRTPFRVAISGASGPFGKPRHARPTLCLGRCCGLGVRRVRRLP